MMSPWGGPAPRQQVLSQPDGDSSLTHARDESAVIKAAWSPMQGRTLTSETREEVTSLFLSAQSGSMASSEATASGREKLGAADSTPQSRFTAQGSTVSPMIFSSGKGESPTEGGKSSERRAAFANKLAMFNGGAADPGGR